MELPEIHRRPTRAVRVGGVTVGGGAPVVVQSMTNTPTADAEATIEQVRRLAEAGAELVRVAAASRADTAALRRIVTASPVPIIADVHFHFERALEAIDAGAAKVRLNPGNIRQRSRVRRVIVAARDAGIAIRVGVNEGSVVERVDARRRTDDLRKGLVELMVARLDEYLQVFRDEGFEDLVLSAKSHDALATVAVNRELSRRWDHPLHLGVTHAGTAETGAIRSAAALGALLAEGIGDTVRISFAGDPLGEVRAARELLWSLRLRRRDGVELIACPTCGRTLVDVGGIAERVRAALADVKAPLTVAVMGCVVNGPGEAEGADVAVCCGRGRAVLYRRGKRLRTISADEIVEAVVAEARALAE